MNYYAKFTFTQSPYNVHSYMLDSSYGKVEGLNFLQYAETKANAENGISNRQYMLMSIPRNESIRKYFAYTFEVKGQILTSTEGLDSKKRTFGDAKKLGLNDLILFQFSDDQTHLSIYFIKDKGSCKWIKQDTYERWNQGEKLEAA